MALFIPGFLFLMRLLFILTPFLALQPNDHEIEQNRAEMVTRVEIGDTSI